MALEFIWRKQDPDFPLPTETWTVKQDDFTVGTIRQRPNKKFDTAFIPALGIQACHGFSNFLQAKASVTERLGF